MFYILCASLTGLWMISSCSSICAHADLQSRRERRMHPASVSLCINLPLCACLPSSSSRLCVYLSHRSRPASTGLQIWRPVVCSFTRRCSAKLQSGGSGGWWPVDQNNKPLCCCVRWSRINTMSITSTEQDFPWYRVNMNKSLKYWLQTSQRWGSIYGC